MFHSNWFGGTRITSSYIAEWLHHDKILSIRSERVLFCETLWYTMEKIFCMKYVKENWVKIRFLMGFFDIFFFLRTLTCLMREYLT